MANIWELFLYVLFVAAFLAGILLWPKPCSGHPDQNPSEALFNAIRQVETGGEPNDGRDAVGDCGASIGPYQIQRAYWQDAVEYDSTIGGSYEDVKNEAYARKVMLAYWKRYAPANASNEQLARIHNGGPRAMKKKSTESYWLKVKKILEAS